MVCQANFRLPIAVFHEEPNATVQIGRTRARDLNLLQCHTPTV
jgi:hypothetical protein